MFLSDYIFVILNISPLREEITIELTEPKSVLQFTICQINAFNVMSAIIMTQNPGIKGLSLFMFIVQHQDFYDSESALRVHTWVLSFSS